MKSILKRGISFVLIVAMMCSVAMNRWQVVALAEELDESDETGTEFQDELEIEFLEKRITDTSAYLRYFIVVDGKKEYITESLELKGKTIVSSISSTGVNENNVRITVTEEEQSTIVIEECNEEELPTESSYEEMGKKYNWKSYSKTYSLKGAKFAILSVSAILVAVSKMGLGTAISVAASVVNFLLSQGRSKIPNSIYFSGKRCVSRSCGRIFYKYKGNFYDSSKKKTLYAKGISWSRRWGR